MKFLHIIGARPQFIKYFPLQQAFVRFRAGAQNYKSILVHTGQHYDYRMSRIFFDELGLDEPDYHLEVGSGFHGQQTALILERVEDVLIKTRPDIVIVYGDTNSTLGGALAAAKLHIPVAHVEAGLRSFNKAMPEEINRILTDHISTYMFCPSETAVKNLKHESLSDFVFNVGDIVYDMLIHAKKLAEQKSIILQELDLSEKKYDLLTIHRAENTDNQKSLGKIIRFINDATGERDVIFPMHPRMINIYKKSKVRLSENVRIIEPAGYFDMLMLLNNAARIFTDSGGIQKEAYWLKVPCITLRTYAKINSHILLD